MVLGTACPQGRRTICRAMTVMAFCMFLISWTQGPFALSSGESELDDLGSGVLAGMFV